jgi:hypothetical protein
MLTEFGGIAFAKGAQPTAAPDQLALVAAGNSSVVTWGYSTANDEQTFQQRYQELMGAVIYTAMFAGFCYTQFADTFQEVNGLLTADRKPKIPIEEIARATRVSRLHIAAGV